MENPALYAETNTLVHKDIRELLDEYIPLVHFRKDGGDRVLDIGCGPGDVTVKVLLPRLPKSVQELVATDLNPVMTEFARKHHSHPKVKYDLLDIATQKLPKAFHENFDHVFSFYVLHWLQDQRQVMTNVFNLLQPGGDTVLIYLSYTPVGEIFQILGRKEIFKPYMKNVMDWVAPHQYVKDVEGPMTKLLQEVGFEKITCHQKPRHYVHSDFDAYKVLMESVNPFIRQMPDQLRETFISVFYSELKNQAMAEGFMKEGTDAVDFPYALLVINATKPKQAYI